MEGCMPRSGHNPADGKLFVIAKRIGRLGNRLALFANFIAFAEEYGHRLVNASFYADAHFFETTRRDIFCRYPAAPRGSLLGAVPGVAGAIRASQIVYQTAKTTARWHEKHPLCGERVVTLRDVGSSVTLLDGPEVRTRIGNARIVFVHGWFFRAPHLVKLHAEKIRPVFRPAAEYLLPSRQAVESLRRDADVVVGVHIRRGDYAAFLEGKYFFDISQYASWMHEVAEQFPQRRVSFLVCSDEPRHESEFPQLSVGFGPCSPIGDLYALAECDYILGPMSTFSQWASFYGAKPLLLLQSGNDRADLDRFAISWLDEVP